jgi:6-pyruvoyltetrahydropterin/6-carboxytetrahydropterin synthase
MSILTEFSVASRFFESARELPHLPADHRCHGLHGHSFRASVCAVLEPGWASFVGSEASALEACLKETLAPLHYGCLNDHLPHPTDENLARWLRHQLPVPGIQRITIQSTTQQGIDLDAQGQVHRWRRFHFRAAHRLPQVPVSHPCGRMHGHRFAVVVHVVHSLEDAQVDQDAAITHAWATLAEQLDYQCLNDIPGLENPTSEHLAAWIWTALKHRLPNLNGVSVFETQTCGSHFDGTDYRIWKTFNFDSACQLLAAPDGSPRRRLHGHTYMLRLYLREPLDRVMGWTTDFGVLKARFTPIFERIDHQDLRQLTGLDSSDTPRLAYWLFQRTQALMPSLTQVDLYEAPGCGTTLMNESATPLMPLS